MPLTTVSSRTTTGARPTWLAVIVGVWVVTVLGFLALVAFEAAALGPAACELAPGTSIFGEARWSWAQLGQVCTWELPDLGSVALERGPGGYRWFSAMVLALWGASLLTARVAGAGRVPPP